MYSQIDVNLISDFVESVKNCLDQISGRAGAICGALRSDIIDFSFCGLKIYIKNGTMWKRILVCVQRT